MNGPYDVNDRRLRNLFINIKLIIRLNKNWLPLLQGYVYANCLTKIHAYA